MRGNRKWWLVRRGGISAIGPIEPPYHYVIFDDNGDRTACGIELGSYYVRLIAYDTFNDRKCRCEDCVKARKNK